MSSSLELYNDYLCHLIIYGYARTVMGIEMLRDICCVCITFIDIPSNLITDIGYDIGKIEYLLLKYTLPDIIHHRKTFKDILYCKDGNKTYPYQNWKPVLDGKRWTQCDFPFISQMKDKQLLNSLLICLNWSWMLRQRHLNIHGYSKYDLCNKHINVIIDIAKKGIALKYKYVSQLLAMYDCYYFDLYILKVIKQKLSKIDTNSLMEALQQTVIEELTNSNINFDGNFDFQKWNNSNSMKMSSLLQVILLEYPNNVEDVMRQITNITDIIDIKYRIIQSHLSDIMNQEQKTFKVDDGGSMLNKIFKATIIIPSIVVCVAGSGIYKVVSGDQRFVGDIVVDTLDWMFDIV